MRRIRTPGYRGIMTGFIFIPPGEYGEGNEVDLTAHTLPGDLVNHLIHIGNAIVIEDASSAGAVRSVTKPRRNR